MFGVALVVLVHVQDLSFSTDLKSSTTSTGSPRFRLTVSVFTFPGALSFQVIESTMVLPSVPMSPRTSPTARTVTVTSECSGPPTCVTPMPATGFPASVYPIDEFVVKSGPAALWRSVSSLPSCCRMMTT